MRHSTQEEKDDYEAMLKRKSTVLTTSEEFEQLESENASLRGAAQGLGRLCDQYKAENDKLRELVNSYADLFEKEAATNNGHGPYYSGEDWLVLANDMRIELAKCCGEIGIEVE